MAFVSRVEFTALSDENARLLDRLTKQQEINQSLRVENAQLNKELEEKDANWNDWLNKAFGDDLYPISPSPEPEDFVEKVLSLRGEIEELKHREYCLRQDAKGHSPSEVQEYRDEIEELKKQIANHESDKRKACLSAKYFAWRGPPSECPDYSVEEEAEWLIGETTNIQDAVDIFNEFYGDECCCEESIYQLECDHLRKWKINELWMDDEGNYTLTEEEFERNNADEEEKKSCDFCDKERQVLTKRDAGYDEWTCSECHREQYPEQYQEDQ